MDTTSKNWNALSIIPPLCMQGQSDALSDDEEIDLNSDSNYGSESDDDTRDEGEEADEPIGVSMQHKTKYGPNERILFDKCTIRTWFLAMDTAGSGFVSKYEFIKWLTEHRELRQILVK